MPGTVLNARDTALDKIGKAKLHGEGVWSGEEEDK